MEKSILQDILEDINDGKFSIRSYSGRGMYGKSCLAIVENRECHVNPMLLGFEISEALRDRHIDDDDQELAYTTNLREISHVLNVMRSDSMGCGSVYYFPKVPYFDDGYDEDEVYGE